MHIIGLTGSIGMGKSTTAAMFAKQGIPVWDADAAVREIYSKGGSGAEALKQLFTEAVSNGTVNRDTLKQLLQKDPTALKVLEEVIHPLVAQHRSDFLARTKSEIVVLDVPLLFETGLSTTVDTIVVVSAPPEIQKERVMARPGMTEKQFEFIMSQQLADTKKRTQADFVINTDSIQSAYKQVTDIIDILRSDLPNA